MPRRLPTDRWRNLAVAVSPQSEQRAILEALRISTQTIVALTNRLQCEVTLLREYHTRPIADMVTGKLDVRERGGTTAGHSCGTRVNR